MSNQLFPFQKRPNTPRGAGFIDLSNLTVQNLRPALEQFAQRIQQLEQSNSTETGWLDLIPRRFAADSAVTTKSAAFTADNEIEWYRVSASGGAVTATVPLAINHPGRKIGFIKTDSGSNAVTLTRSGSDTINGATTFPLQSQYQVCVIKSDGISAWDIESVTPVTFTWTPVLTFATAGDLNVVYSAQFGQGSITGKKVYLEFNITTSTFTHTTAAGNCRITGSPFTNGSSSSFPRGILQWSGITKANYTQVNNFINGNSAIIELRASGSGVAISAVSTSDMPTGGTVALSGSITFFTA